MRVNKKVLRVRKKRKAKQSHRWVGKVVIKGFPFKTPSDWFAIDTECTGLDPWGTYGVDRPFYPCRPFAFSLCNEDGETAYIQLPVCAYTRKIKRDKKAIALLQELLGNPDIAKVFHNCSYDHRMLTKSGLRIRGELYDTLIGAHVINPDEMTYGLKPLATKYLGVTDDDQKKLLKQVHERRKEVQQARRNTGSAVDKLKLQITELESKRYAEVVNGNPIKASRYASRITRTQVDLDEALEKLARDRELARYYIAEPPYLADTDAERDGAASADYWLADQDLCEEYAVRDAVRTAMLHIAQVEHLDEDEKEGGKLWTVYRRELRLMDTIRRMEDRGIRLDLERNNEVREFYDDHVKRIGKKIRKHVPEGFNPNSPKQMAEEFFGRRDYTPLEYGSKKTHDGVVYSPCQHCATPMLRDDGTGPVKRPKTTKNGKVIQQVVKHSPGCKVCQYTGKNPKCNSDFLSQIAGSNEPNSEDPDGDDIYVMKDELAYYLCEHTACTNMLNFVNSYDLLRHKTETDGVPYWVLSPNYKQCGPITGRLSCTKPNMMNVASDSTGRKRSNIPYRTRECFVPRKGYTLYMPDYSQIEVWVFASLSQDPDFLATLLSGEDFHGGIAKRVWGHLWDQEAAEAAEHKDPSKMTKLEAQASATKKYYRKRAKLLMFCKLYGGGAAKVASLLECTRGEAESFIADYDARLPGVKKYMSEMVSIAKRDGFVTNPFGRTYPINRQLAYRATNYMVQGTSAEIMKNALNCVDELCYTNPRYVGKVFPLLTVHDEIILEVADAVDDKRTMLDIVRCMQNDHKTVGCPKPFPVGMKVAKERWSVTHEIESSYYEVEIQ